MRVDKSIDRNYTQRGDRHILYEEFLSDMRYNLPQSQTHNISKLFDIILSITALKNSIL